MSALPLTALRPLAFPCHRWIAVLCLRTGRVLAVVEARSAATADPAVSGQTFALSPAAYETARLSLLTAHGNARRAPRVIAAT